MRIFNKLFLVVILSISLFIKQADAQNMRMVSSMLNRQIATQQMNMMTFGRFNFGRFGGYNAKYSFDITLPDFNTLKVKSKIYSDTVLHKNYLIYEDKNIPKSDSGRFKRIYPAETMRIVRTNTDQIGMPKDSCWMFQVIGGKINVYSFLSEDVDDPNFDLSSIVGIQLNDGAIEKFTEENLKTMVGKDDDAIKNIAKKDYVKAIKKFNHNAEKAAKK